MILTEVAMIPLWLLTRWYVALSVAVLLTVGWWVATINCRRLVFWAPFIAVGAFLAFCVALFVIAMDHLTHM